MLATSSGPGGRCLYDAVLVAQAPAFELAQGQIEEHCGAAPLVFDTAGLSYLAEARNGLAGLAEKKLVGLRVLYGVGEGIQAVLSQTLAALQQEEPPGLQGRLKAASLPACLPRLHGSCLPLRPAFPSSSPQAWRQPVGSPVSAVPYCQKPAISPGACSNTMQ